MKNFFAPFRAVRCKKSFAIFLFPGCKRLNLCYVNVPARNRFFLYSSLEIEQRNEMCGSVPVTRGGLETIRLSEKSIYECRTCTNHRSCFLSWRV